MAIPTIPKVQSFDLDITNFEIIVAYANQYEENVSVIELNILDQGEVVQIDTSSSISFQATKPDGKVIIYRSDVIEPYISLVGDNKIVIKMTPELCNVFGRVECSVSFEKNNIAYTCNFYIRVHKAAVQDKTVVSSNDYVNMLDKAEKKAEDICEYYNQQFDDKIHSLDGALIAKGNLNTISELPTTAKVGDSYNIKTAFDVDARFVDYDPSASVQAHYNAGTNVYYNADGLWDALSGTFSMEETVDIDFNKDW